MHTPTRILLAVVMATAIASPAAVAHELPVRAQQPISDNAYFHTDNVEYLARFPEHVATAGGRLLDDRFYLTDSHGVYVYDITDPAAPVELGRTSIVQTGLNAAVGQEDPDTNGRILLVDAIDPASLATSASLQVVDVSDPTAPSILATAPVTDHTWTCVNDCTYAYGRTGHVVDLRDPANPIVTATNWRETIGVGSDPYTHDFTEVAPGRLFSAGQPSFYLDVTDPEEPVEITRIESEFSTLGFHGVEWAQQGRDDIVVLGTEIAPSGITNLAGSDCQGDGIIATFRATEVLAAEDAAVQPDGSVGSIGDVTFTKIDDWRVPGRGAFVDGASPSHTLYCSHWFELHPDFDSQGMIAAGYYDWGTRFLSVDADGMIDEIGWFLPVDGYTSAAYWATDEIVYVADYRRGFEVLRFTATADDPGDDPGGGDPAPDPTATPDPVILTGDEPGNAQPVAASETADPQAAATGPPMPVTGTRSILLLGGLVGIAFGLRRRRETV